MSTSRLAALADTSLFPVVVIMQILPRRWRRTRGLDRGSDGDAPCPGHCYRCDDGARMDRMITMIDATRRTGQVKQSVTNPCEDRHSDETRPD